MSSLNKLAMEIFWLTKRVPKEELFSLTDEPKIWLDFSHDCEYISGEDHERLTNSHNEVGKMLNGLFDKWQNWRFLCKDFS
ncbi:MAG: four helix bundle protein [bacterium]